MRSALGTRLRCCVMVDLSATRAVADEQRTKSSQRRRVPLRRFSPCPRARSSSAPRPAGRRRWRRCSRNSPFISTPCRSSSYCVCRLVSHRSLPVDRAAGRAVERCRQKWRESPSRQHVLPGSTHMRLLRLGSEVAIYHGVRRRNFCKPSVNVIPFGGRRLRAVGARPHSDRNGPRQPRRIARDRRGGRSPHRARRGFERRRACRSRWRGRGSRARCFRSTASHYRQQSLEGVRPRGAA